MAWNMKTALAVPILAAAAILLIYAYAADQAYVETAAKEQLQETIDRLNADIAKEGNPEELERLNRLLSGAMDLKNATQIAEQLSAATGEEQKDLLARLQDVEERLRVHAGNRTAEIVITRPSPAVEAETVYNPDMTDWWADMIEHLGDESSAVWTEPGWGDEVWVEIWRLTEDTYQISLHGIAASGNPITYTITETEDGYDKYGTVLEDGTMDSRTYVKAADGADRQYVYTPSDITKASPNLTMASGDFSMLTDIEETKDSVLFTVYGEILKVGDPIPWTDESGNSLASIPVHMVVKNVSKDIDPDMDLKLDGEFVFYLSGGYEHDIIYVDAFEPQFEIGESVILHIGKADDAYGPMNDPYYVEIGMYGKYRVVDGKAYNENYPTGKLLHSVFDEAK